MDLFNLSHYTSLPSEVLSWFSPPRAGLLLRQRLRRWPNNKPKLGTCARQHDQNPQQSIDIDPALANIQTALGKRLVGSTFSERFMIYHYIIIIIFTVMMLQNIISHCVDYYFYARQEFIKRFVSPIE